MAKIINVVYSEYSNTIRDGITNRAILVKRGAEWSLDMLDISDREPANVDFVARLATAYAFNYSVKWSADGVKLAAFLDHYANGGEFKLKPKLVTPTSVSIPLPCSMVEQRPINVVSSFDAGTHAILLDALTNSRSVLLGGVRDKLGDDLDAGTLKYAFDLNVGVFGGFRVWVDNELIGYIDVAKV